MSNWPDPARPGVPLNPERDGWHWLSAMYYDDPIGPPVACFWEAKLERWPRLQDKPGNYPVSRGFCYLGPAATPAEIAAKDARIAELEAALNQAKQHFLADEPLKAFVEVCTALAFSDESNSIEREEKK